MDLDIARENAHYIAVTGIIRRHNEAVGWQYLICKRSLSERIFPGRWCVPGGRLQQSDFSHQPKDTSDHWLSVLERTLAREIKEETALEIKNIGYVSSLAMLRPNGFSTIIISFFADYAGGEVVLDETELADHQWVTLQEAKHVDLIENIWEQLQAVEKTGSALR